MNDVIADVAGEHLGRATVHLGGVVRSYRSTRVLDGVDLDLFPGVTGLLGPNGAGKTTLLRLLATVLAPDSGELRLLGRDPDVADDRVEIRRRLGYVPQEPGFHQDFSVFEFVDYLAILKEMTDRSARRDEVCRVLRSVGLDEVRHKKIRKLSGGMRRRVAIAQALLGRPELLVLDEPTVGLDPEQRLRFREMLSSVAPGTTVVLSTHQTNDVAALCQRVVVLHEGTIRFDGAPAALAESAVGHVWLTDERHPAARLAWTTAEGRVRNIGEAPPTAELIAPTIEDGYLLLVGDSAVDPRTEPTPETVT
jgi:ABC-2 type transport system ATP-binding protein